MKVLHWFGTLLSIVTLSISVAAPASADFPGLHPHYVHALEYLRDAHTLLSHGDYRPGVEMRIDYALDDIKQAYLDIEKAGLQDGKDVDGGMPPEAGLNRKGRLHKAEQAIQRALQDVSLEESDPHARGLQDRVTVKLNQAIDHLHHAMALVH